jgi:hypothetical protein
VGKNIYHQTPLPATLIDPTRMLYDKIVRTGRMPVYKQGCTTSLDCYQGSYLMAEPQDTDIDLFTPIQLGSYSFHRMTG